MIFERFRPSSGDMFRQNRESWPLRSVAGRSPTIDSEKKPHWLSWKQNSGLDDCTLETAHKHGWKPETMQAPILIAFAISSILLAVLLEILAQQSRKVGGLSLVNTAEDLPSAVTFGYLYLPTIVAVFYSLVWNWIDLDVKRMQPWLELSKPEGSKGRDSLFLGYPVDFVAFVPFKAAKQKHWPVFYSGTIMVLIFWLLTPLQSAVLGTGPVLLRQPTKMMAPSKLMDIGSQAENLDQSVFNAGYAITWLNQPYPAFTTSEYALMPFKPEGDLTSSGVIGNWSGITTKYWTDLECWPAKIHVPNPKMSGSADFDNGMGCNASGIGATSSIYNPDPYKMYYIGYQNSPWSDYSLASPTCGSNASNQFLATWGTFNNKTGKADLAASFCQTHYYKQKVSALVQASTLIPITSHIKPLAPPERLGNSEFNSSAFEHLIAAGVSSVEVPRDYPFTYRLEQYGPLRDLGLATPLSPMLGFALGGQNHTINEYSNTTLLGHIYREAHQTVFAAAFQKLLVNDTGSGQVNGGDANFIKYGVIVSRLFSALVEGFLGLVAILTLSLLWTCQRSPSLLSSDPSSLGALIDLIQGSASLLDKFSGKGHLSDKDLQEKLGGCVFQLNCGCHDRSERPSLRMLEIPFGSSEGQVENTVEESGIDHKGHYSPIKPLPLQKFTGVVFAIWLCAALGVLSYLKKTDTSSKGLVRPSSNFEVNNLLTSYIPTAFSTLIEPFWVLLNRFLCILQPFYDLHSKRKTAERTINARYTALPPQLALWRAAKSGHFLLGAVSIIALLANVLAVGLGAIFDDRPVQKSYPLMMSPQRQPQIDVEGLQRFHYTLYPNITMRYDDPFYPILANMSYGTPFPPWTSADFSFLPVTLPPSSVAQDELYTAVTTGIGADPSCLSLGTFVSTNQPPKLNVSFGRPDGPIPGCKTEYTPSTMFFNGSGYTFPSGRAAAEVIDSMMPPTVIASDCDQSLLVGWSRSTLQNRTGTMRSSFVLCHPTFKTAEFRVTFDQQGYIKAAIPLGDFKSTIPYSSDPKNDTISIFSELNHKFNPLILPWHTEVVSNDWFNHLLKLYIKDDALLDPAAKVPNPDLLTAPVTAVYKMVFANILSLNPFVFAKDNASETILGNRTVTETRIFMSSAAFITSTTILGLYIIMVVVFYVWAVTFFLPRMPTTIGSLLAYIAPSKMVREYDTSVKDTGSTFGFGRFMGSDGRAHIGIEYSEKIVPINPASLEIGETGPVASNTGHFWARRARTNTQDNNWL